MHKFLIKDGRGFEKDFGSSERAAKLARKRIGKDAVCAVHGKDVLWMAPEHADYFRSLMGDFKIVNTAQDIVKHAEARAIRSRQIKGAPRVSHPKFGEGCAVHGMGTGKVLVQFDGQRKALRLVESTLTVLS